MNAPCLQLRVPSGHVDTDTRKLLKAAVTAKLGVSGLIESWNSVGRYATVTYTVRELPPTTCTLVDITSAIDRCEEWEFVLGLTIGGTPVIVSLDDDSPHIACSAGSGAGKSILAMVFAIQILRRGGRVLIIDRKGSHRWARGLDGVTYCTRVEDMHTALIGAASLAEDRNTRAIEEEEGWDPGARVFIIFEEMNSTVALLKAYWENTRDKSDPKCSPAIQAFRDVMFMGRSAKCNLFGVAQMLTANTTGGPEARENFGIRCLARYTLNNWRMLVPQCGMPTRSKARGRWQVVIGDNVYPTQVAFPATATGKLDTVAVRAFIESASVAILAPVIGEIGPPRVSTLPATVEPQAIEPPRFTLSEAAREEWCPVSYQKLRNIRKAACGWPEPAMKGTRETWTQTELLNALTASEGKVR